MTEEAKTETPPTGGQFTDGLERVWSEIKQISKQVEHETRRSGRVARLRLDLRKLSREISQVSARLGTAVYEARTAAGDSLQLQEVDGYAGGIAALDALTEQVRAKEEEIQQLRESSVEVAADSPATASETVAEEGANG